MEQLQEASCWEQIIRDRKGGSKESSFGGERGWRREARVSHLCCVAAFQGLEDTAIMILEPLAPLALGKYCCTETRIRPPWASGPHLPCRERNIMGVKDQCKPL